MGPTLRACLLAAVLVPGVASAQNEVDAWLELDLHLPALGSSAAFSSGGGASMMGCSSQPASAGCRAVRIPLELVGGVAGAFLGGLLGAQAGLEGIVVGIIVGEILGVQLAGESYGGGGSPIVTTLAGLLGVLVGLLMVSAVPTFEMAIAALAMPIPFAMLGFELSIQGSAYGQTGASIGPAAPAPRRSPTPRGTAEWSEAARSDLDALQAYRRTRVEQRVRELTRNRNPPGSVELGPPYAGSIGIPVFEEGLVIVYQVVQGRIRVERITPMGPDWNQPGAPSTAPAEEFGEPPAPPLPRVQEAATPRVDVEVEPALPGFVPPELLEEPPEGDDEDDPLTAPPVQVPAPEGDDGRGVQPAPLW